MNIFQRAYIAFALLALSITLHPGQVQAVDIVTTECTYHFNRVGAVRGRASCQYNDFVDFACNPKRCVTKENKRCSFKLFISMLLKSHRNHLRITDISSFFPLRVHLELITVDSVYYYKCHASDFSAYREDVHAAQYVRRDTYASVQDWDGTWWDCPYNIPEHHNDQYLVCTDCYYVPPKP
ncbi:hypothetical protein PSHT_02164 [Puccinia striiformis]|uniref:Uncharacterized protein n=2 Tax=Puccinia striiformis TaxID=27350 RepID=A0A2S4UQ23_9BASI|nr:hypothetical protein PSTT_13800 [Puccinia striiformis]POW21646.1 hypothetical protein PSHT_02164 [Puccinia striiformis]